MSTEQMGFSKRSFRNIDWRLMRKFFSV